MPARDIHHDVVKDALIKDGWTITADPLVLHWGERRLFVDFGAERLIGAQRDERKIAVEVKTFSARSDMHSLEQALGQFVLYHALLERVEPDRELYIAIEQEVWLDIFQEPIGRLVLQRESIQLIVFEPATGEIVRWYP